MVLERTKQGSEMDEQSELENLCKDGGSELVGGVCGCVGGGDKQELDILEGEGLGWDKEPLQDKESPRES